MLETELGEFSKMCWQLRYKETLKDLFRVKMVLERIGAIIEHWETEPEIKTDVKMFGVVKRFEQIQSILDEEAKRDDQRDDR